MHRHVRRYLVALVSVVSLALAAGCGSAGDATGTSEAGGDSGGAIAIEHAKGTLELDKPATRVVALEWTYAEDLLALGVRPAGVADIAGYQQFVTASPELGSGVRDVGTRQAPSLETIRALQPDLIITTDFRSESNYAQLQQIAPTLVFEPYETEQTQYDYMRTELQAIGKAVGKQDQAAQVLAELDATLADVEQRIAEVGKAGTDVVVARGYTANDVPVIELLTNDTVPGVLLGKVGLTNAWTGEPSTAGLSQVSVEDLKQVEDAHFMYVAEQTDDVFAEKLSRNALWQQLAFVEQDRVHELDPGTWFFGGPLSAQQIVEEYAKALGA